MPRDVNDHLRSGKSSSSTDNEDMNVDADADADVVADAAKVVGVVKAVDDPSTGYDVAK